MRITAAMLGTAILFVSLAVETEPGAPRPFPQAIARQSGSRDRKDP